jgi:hypothetical protein
MDVRKQETQNNKKRVINVITISLIQNTVPWNKEKKNLSIKQVTKYMWKIGK